MKRKVWYKKRYYLGSSVVIKSPLLLSPLPSEVLLQIHTQLLAINILAGKGSSYAPRKIFFKPALANKKQKIQKKVNHGHKTWKETNKLNESHPSSGKIFNQFFLKYLRHIFEVEATKGRAIWLKMIFFAIIFQRFY